MYVEYGLRCRWKISDIEGCSSGLNIGGCENVWACNRIANPTRQVCVVLYTYTSRTPGATSLPRIYKYVLLRCR